MYDKCLNFLTMLHFCCGLIVAGSHVLRTIALNKDVEIAAIERKSAVVTANNESFLIRLSSPEGSFVVLHVILSNFINSSLFNMLNGIVMLLMTFE